MTSGTTAAEAGFDLADTTATAERGRSFPVLATTVPTVTPPPAQGEGAGFDGWDRRAKSLN
jgi:hypothetical protein